MAAEVMAQSGLAFADLDRIAVSIGPGSFTGVRVGVAFAKGLASALSIPCVGIGALEALAAQAEGRFVVAVSDGGRGQLNLQARRDGVAVTPPTAVPFAEAVDWVRAHFTEHGLHIVGPAAGLIAEAFPAAKVEIVAAPAPFRLADLGAHVVPAAAPARPIYLRPADAKTLEERRA